MARARSAVAAAVFFALGLLLVPFRGNDLRSDAALPRRAFLDPALAGRRGEVAVIVTSRRDSKAAAAAVRKIGGRITSDLWIVNAVGAVVSASSLRNLIADPAVASVVNNQRVRSAAEWNGWMSDLRMIKGQYSLSSSTAIYAAPAHLPNGGFAQITSNTLVTTSGELIIVNPDGSERARTTLTVGGPFASPAVADSTGRIFVGAVYGCMYGIAADGTVLWQNASMLNSTYFYAPPVIASDGTVIAVTYYGVVYGFDPATGAIRWQQSIVKNKAEYKTAPILAPDDTMYVSSDQGDIFAITASGGVRWSAALNGAQQGNYTGATPAYSNGVLYAVSGPKLVAFDSVTGAIKFSFTADTTLVGSAVIAPDGGVLVASPTRMYAFTANGQLQWSAVPPLNSLSFIRTPLVTPDNATIFIASGVLKGNKLPDYIAGFVRNSGASKFSPLAVTGYVGTSTSLDPDGGMIFGGKNDASLYRVGPEGSFTHRIKLHTTITDLSQLSSTGNIVVRLGLAPQIIFCGRTANEWNGRKDVETGSIRGNWKLVFPYVADVGADVLHKQTISGGNTYILGGDVGVAVVDSGVYWDSDTKALLGVQLQRQFIGQADFLQPVCATTLGCVQNVDNAFYDYNTSRDAYGHGTHVAGTISNKLVDEIVGQGQNDQQLNIGIAPDARILSVRVLGADGTGSYETVIKGIQYVVANKANHAIRVMNLSLSAYATVPYFVDPLCRAAEKAWQAGIVVLAAAGNTGPFAQSITVPGNDPYVITVGAVNSGRTSAFWRDDIKAPWSATGPTFDGFPKPDVLAPGSQIVSYMFNGGLVDPNTPTLVRLHPDYSASAQLFRMNGTSMATAVASGVVALMLQVNPLLTPDQVKYRLMESARPSIDKSGALVYNTFQQGLGRIWAPDAVLSPIDPAGYANLGMNINGDLAHGYDTLDDLAFHYQGPVRHQLNDAGDALLYYATDSGGTIWGLGISTLDGQWLSSSELARMSWAGDLARMSWAGGLSWAGDNKAFTSARMGWAGSRMSWAGDLARMSWAGARLSWAGDLARMSWAGGISWTGGDAWSVARMSWAGNTDAYSVARMSWAGAITGASMSGSSIRWIDDTWLAPPSAGLPKPAGAQ